MKHLSVIAYSLIVFSCHSQVAKIGYVTVKYVNPGITTPIQIKCEAFEKSFGEYQMKEKKIEDKETISSLEKILGEVKYSKQLPSIDVRAKFYFYFSEESNPKVICLNKFDDVSIDGALVVDSKNLVDLLKKLLE